MNQLLRIGLKVLTIEETNMNTFNNQFEMISALLDGFTVLANTGEKYFMVDKHLNVEYRNDDIIETETLPDYKTSKIYLERWHNDLTMSCDGDFDNAILCHVGDDIRLVTGYCEKTDRYVLINKDDCFTGEYVKANECNPVTSLNSLKQFMKM